MGEFIAQQVLSSLSYPLRNFLESIQERFSHICRHFVHHGAQREHNKAVITGAIYKLLQVLLEKKRVWLRRDTHVHH